MSLITFHRILIGAAAIFCFGFALWELVLWWVTKANGSLLVGVAFLVFGVLTSIYLAKLKQIVGYQDKK